MKKIFSINILLLLLFFSTAQSENYVSWGKVNVNIPGNTTITGTTAGGTTYTKTNDAFLPTNYGVSWDIYSVNKDSGAMSVLASWSLPDGGGVDHGVSIGDGSYFDNTSGYFYAVQGNDSVKVFDLMNNATEMLTLPVGLFSGDNSATYNASNFSELGVSKIIDNEGKQIISKSATGEVHIGENSLVTHEVNGVQQLYATDANGNQIDINIKSGTNLLIDGTNVMSLVSGIQQDISGSVALSSALAALPNSSPDAFYTCGLGIGIHDSSSALSAGCASDFSNYTFVDKMPKIFQTASFNLGSSFLMNGEPDISEVRDMSIKAGITFKFGSVKPTRVSDRSNYMLENKIDAVMAKNEVIQSENDLLKAQIVEINTQLKALNIVAMN